MSRQLPVRVEFCGTYLEGVVSEGRAYVAMKPIAEGMGLDWDKQLQRIKDHPVLGDQLSPLKGVVAEDGRRREMMCLPEDILPFWMALVNANRVRAIYGHGSSPIRGKLRGYCMRLFQKV